MSGEHARQASWHTDSGVVTRSIPPQRLIDAINPLVRWLARSPLHRLVDRSMAVLHVVGRRTGRVYDIPVGVVRVGDRLVVVTQHRWRVNLRGVRRLDVTENGRRHTVDVTLVEEPAGVAATLAEVIETIGWREARRRLGLATSTGRPPTAEQLTRAAEAYRLGILALSAPSGSAPLGRA
jgi:hypothetical protein